MKDEKPLKHAACTTEGTNHASFPVGDDATISWNIFQPIQIMDRGVGLMGRKMYISRQEETTSIHQESTEMRIYTTERHKEIAPSLSICGLYSWLFMKVVIPG